MYAEWFSPANSLISFKSWGPVEETQASLWHLSHVCVDHILVICHDSSIYFVSVQIVLKKLDVHCLWVFEYGAEVTKPNLALSSCVLDQSVYIPQGKMFSSFSRLFNYACRLFIWIWIHITFMGGGSKSHRDSILVVISICSLFLTLWSVRSISKYCYLQWRVCGFSPSQIHFLSLYVLSFACPS